MEFVNTQKNFEKEPEISIASIEDIPSILNLQKNNLGENLEEKEKKEEGFVTFKATPEILKDVILEGETVIANMNGELAGYLISCSLEKTRNIPFFKDLITNMDSLNYEEKPLKEYKNCIMLQVAVSKKWRGLGIDENLHSAIKEKLSNKYDLGISEIAEENKKSLHIHMDKVGYKNIGKYFSGGREWIIVALDLKSK